MWQRWKCAGGLAVLAVAVGALVTDPVGAIPFTVLEPQRDLEIEPPASPSSPGEADPLRSALDLVNAGKYDEAIAGLDKFLKEHPNSALGLEILGAALALKGNTDQGLAALKRAATLDPRRSSAITKIGDIYLAKGQVNEARQQFLRAIGISPDDRRAHQRLGLIFEREGKADLAIRHLEKGIEGTPPEYLGVKVDLGRLYNRANQFEKTVALLQNVVTRDTRDAAAHVVLGTAYQGQRRTDRAAQEFQTAVQLEPENYGGHLALGIAYRSQGKLTEALAEMEKATQLNPRSDTAQFQLGETLFFLEDFDRALASFRAAEKLNPKLVPARKRVADTLVAQKKIPQAIPIYKELLQRPGLDTADLFDALGTAYQLNNQPDQAEKTFQDMMRKYPKNPDVYLRLGAFYGYQKKYDRALDQFNRGLKLATDKRSFYRAISVAQLRKGDRAAAVTAAEDLVKQPAAGVEDTFYLATLYQEGKRTDDALKLYSEIVAVHPDHVPAQNNLAMMLSDAGKHDEALAHALKALALAPENSTVVDTYGWILLRQGKVQEGLASIKKATGLAPSNATIAYHLAVAHSKNGEPREALEAASRAVGLSKAFPEYHEAVTLRNQLQGKK